MTINIEITIKDRDTGLYAIVEDPDYVDEAIDLLRQNVFFVAHPNASILDYIRQSNVE
jgi:hypothetical protein